LIPIFLILILAPIFAVAQCWSQISCSDSGTLAEASIISPDYKTQITAEEYCEIGGINPDAGASRSIEIQMVSGGYKDSDRDVSWFIDDAFIAASGKIYFYFNKSVSPVYIVCHEIILPDFVNNFEITRMRTLQTWSSSYDGGTFDFINPVEKANEWYLVNGNNTLFALQLRDTNILTGYTNYPANNSNPLILAVAWSFIVVGFLGLLLILVAVDKEWF
jgi:hypothetical protein